MAQFTFANTYDDAVAQYQVTEWLAQLAEEASELAQAALKYRRALEPGALWIPKSPEELACNLIEEFADVKSCIEKVVKNSELVRGALDVTKAKEERFVQRHNMHKVPSND